MTRRRRFLLLTLTLLLALSASAQRRLTFRIADFSLAEEDLTARNEKYQVKDNDGNLCAIVKVKTDNPEDSPNSYKFDFGTYIDVKRTEMHDDALWIWVQQGAKKISIRREGYTAISQHPIGMTLQKGRTYNLLLSAQMPEVKYRIVQFQVSPANEGAIVKVKREDSDGDYELWGAVDERGGKARRLETGVVYRYEVSASNYKTSEGRIVLTYDAENNHVEEVTLTPNFGYLEVADEHGIAGAEIYVDNKLIGTVPYTSNERWEVRDNYRIMISKGELYKTYSATFAIRNGEITRLTPKLEANFAETTITVPDNAEIFIDGESRGRGKWTGPLRAGTYNVECRLDDLHRPTRRQITVKPDKAETFQMDAPTPITGNVYISSSPLGATIQLDGKAMGQTPREIKGIVIGRHDITLSLSKYKNEKRQIDVKENQSTEVEIRLTANRGESESENKPTKQKKEKTEQTQVYQKPSSFHLMAGAQVGSLMGVGATVGGYIKHVNLEAFFLYGLGHSEDIYWQKSSSDYYTCRYKTMAYGGKVGYGIDVLKTKRLRLTPQLGATLVSISADTSNGYALSLAVGLRADYAFTKHFGTFLAPEMDFAVKKSDVFSQLTDVSSKIKHWGTGFNLRIGIRYSF